MTFKDPYEQLWDNSYGSADANLVSSFAPSFVNFNVNGPWQGPVAATPLNSGDMMESYRAKNARQ
jgi:hypothetical protein